jgi:hypothetical protein
MLKALGISVAAKMTTKAVPSNRTPKAPHFQSFNRKE